MRGEFGGEDTPIIGTMRWVPGEQLGSVREVAPERCPAAGHDLRPPGAKVVGWHPGHALREYTCRACLDEGRPKASWCVAKDDDAMWAASRAGRKPTR